MRTDMQHLFSPDTQSFECREKKPWKWGALSWLVVVAGLLSCESGLPVQRFDAASVPVPIQETLQLSGPKQRCIADPALQVDVCYSNPPMGPRAFYGVHGVANEVVWFAQGDAIWGQTPGAEGPVQMYRKEGATLIGVYAVNRDLAWAVGRVEREGKTYGLVVKWDGRQWTEYGGVCVTFAGGDGLECSPERLEKKMEGKFLRGVYATSQGEAWLVGGDQSSNGLVYHIKSGILTQEETVPKTGGLYAIWGSAPTDVYIVGDGGTILHYDGRNWVQTISVTIKFPRAVWGSGPKDVYAVGGYGVIVHYDGSSWTSMYSDTTEWLRAVWGSGPKDVYAVGDSGAMVHYDGSSWTRIDGLPGTDFFTDVWGSGPKDVYAVERTGVVLHYDGSGWTLMHIKDSFNGTWGSSSKDVYAVAYDMVAHYDGRSWMSMKLGTKQDLKAVWVSGTGHIYAVGVSGTIMHYNGSEWTPMTSGTRQPLNAVWGSGPGGTYAVGGNGTILNHNGSEWKTMTPVTDSNLTGVWGTSRNDVYAVGGQGTILHYDGAKWTPMTPVTDSNLTGVWGSGAGDVYAVGGQGTILHYDGAKWTPMTSDTTKLLRAVWGSGLNNVYAVGYAGMILHYDGAKWVNMTPVTDSNLTGVWGSGAGDVYAVGGQGTILQLKKSAALH